MAFFCIYMMHIALELAKENRIYESLATKFFQHYTFIGKAMKNVGGRDFRGTIGMDQPQQRAYPETVELSVGIARHRPAVVFA